MTAPRPRIAIVLTGGTLSMVGRDRVDLLAYRETGKRLSDEEVLARVPELADMAEVIAVPFAAIESTAVNGASWVALLECIEHLFAMDEADGIVVTHGTNTLEETAYFLHLALRSPRPVVLTGSMRPASSLSSDGDMNLMRAVSVAACRESIGKGVLVVMDEAIVSARDVVKAQTTAMDAFQGRGTGSLGFADGRTIRFNHSPARPHTAASEFSVHAGCDLPRVDVVISYACADGTAIDAYTAQGARGLVVAGTGSGAASPSELEAADRAVAAGTTVCMSTRVPAGSVPQTPDFIERGFIAAGDLSPWKARILLCLGLTITSDPHELQRLFDTY